MIAPACLLSEGSPSLNQIGGVVLVAYLVLLVGIGIVGFLKSRATEEDFYLAGRDQGFLVTVMTIMATFFSSAAILGIPGMVYKDGVSFLLFAMNLPCAGVAVYLLGSRIRRVGRKRSYVTQGDMIAGYYGDSAAIRIAVAMIGFLYVLPYIIMQIKAGGYLARGMFPDAGNVALFGKEFGMFELGATALSLVTMIYVLIGGMRSVAWTDVVQGFLLLGGMVLAAVVTMAAMGGPVEFFRKVSALPPDSLSLPGPSGTWTPWKLMTVCLFASTASMIQPGQWIRYYSARNDRALKQSALIFAVALPICYLFGVMLVALGGRVLYPPEMTGDGLIANPAVGEFDQIVVVMIKEHLPAMMGVMGAVLVAVVLVAVLAASMSTADSNLHALSAVVTRDIYDRFVRPGSSQKERAWVGRIVIVAATLLALLLVTTGQESEELSPLKLIADLMFAAIAFACQLMPVTIDMCFIRRGTKAGALAGMISGVLVVFLFTPFPGLLFGSGGLIGDVMHMTGTLQTLFDIGFCGFAVNCSVFAAVSCFTSRLDSDKVAEFARDMLSTSEDNSTNPS